LWKEVRQLAPRTLLEIGVWQGVTARQLIEHALAVSGRVDYWGFDLFAEGMNAELMVEEAALKPLAMAEVRERLAVTGANVHLVAGNTKDTLPVAKLPPIDVAFIDGGHSYETVKSDWNNVIRFLHERSVVYFDDYNNVEAEARANFGVKRLVDEIDRREWQVDLLSPVDSFVHPWGILRTRFARVQRRG
jgi:predicted O-methyltransferase YrrM